MPFTNDARPLIRGATMTHHDDRPTYLEKQAFDRLVAEDEARHRAELEAR